MNKMDKDFSTTTNANPEEPVKTKRGVHAKIALLQEAQNRIEENEHKQVEHDSHPKGGVSARIAALRAAQEKVQEKEEKTEVAPKQKGGISARIAALQAQAFQAKEENTEEKPSNENADEETITKPKTASARIQALLAAQGKMMGPIIPFGAPRPMKKIVEDIEPQNIDLPKEEEITAPQDCICAPIQVPELETPKDDNIVKDTPAKRRRRKVNKSINEDIECGSKPVEKKRKRIKVRISKNPIESQVSEQIKTIHKKKRVIRVKRVVVLESPPQEEDGLKRKRYRLATQEEIEESKKISNVPEKPTPKINEDDFYVPPAVVHRDRRQTTGRRPPSRPK